MGATGRLQSVVTTALTNNSQPNPQRRSPALFLQVVLFGKFRIDPDAFHLRFVQLHVIHVTWHRELNKLIDTRRQLNLVVGSFVISETHGLHKSG